MRLARPSLAQYYTIFTKGWQGVVLHHVSILLSIDGEEDVVGAIGVEGRVQVDEGHASGGDVVLLQDRQIVAVVELVHEAPKFSAAKSGGAYWYGPDQEGQPWGSP